MQDRGARAAARTLARGARGRPVPARRWPWAVAAVAAGALSGAAVALALRRGRAGGAVQEPEELQAVVDRPDGTTTGS